MANCQDPDCLVTKAVGSHSVHSPLVKIAGDEDASIIKMPLSPQRQRSLNFEDSKRRLNEGKDLGDDTAGISSSRTDRLQEGIDEGVIVPMDLGRASVKIKRMRFLRDRKGE